MQKKLTEEKLREILDAGVQAFAEKGLENATMSDIARRAGISVGVLYKYYKDKDDFFLACVRSSAEEMQRILEEIIAEMTKPLDMAEAMIRKTRELSREKGIYIRLYQEMVHARRMTPELVREVESFQAETYTKVIREAQERGAMRKDLDPALLAMFFDNCLMMYQFSFVSPYFAERAKIYGGEHALEGDWLAEGMLRFMESAFTLESKDIAHRED